MNLLPQGNRVDDPPPKKSSLKFRLALAAKKHPTQIAVAIAMAVVAIPVWLVISSQSDLRQATHELQSSQRDLRESNGQLKHALKSSQSSRAATSRTFCRSLNRNARANNAQTSYFIRIVEDAKKRPPNPGITKVERDRVVDQFVKTLRKTQVPKVNCSKLVERVEESVRQASGR